MKTVLLLLRTKLFLLGFLFTCTFILANNYIQRNDPFRFTEVKENIVAKPENSAVTKRKAAKQKMKLQLHENSFRGASAYFDATVQTDKADYYPGDTVIITGSGWAPGETVELIIEHSTVTHGTTTLYAVADIAGTIYNSEFIIQPEHLGELFNMDAYGLTSMNYANAIFTDASSVTPASSGINISADKALNSAFPVGGTFTTLGTITVAEGTGNPNRGDFANSGTLILTAPTGWKFNPGAGGVSFTPSRDITAASINVLSNTITVTLTIPTIAATDAFAITGIQVKPDDGSILTNSGNILRTSGNPGSATIVGVTNDVTNFGSLSQGPGIARSFLVESSPSGGNIPDQTTGAPFTIKLTATDQFSKTATSFSGSGNNVTISSNATLTTGSGATANFSAGVLASHSVTISPAFTGATITATKSPATGTSNAFNVTGAAGGLTVDATTCAQGGSFTITYSPESGSDVTETKTTPFTFTAKKNTSYSITSISSTVNGNTYTGATTVTGTTPNSNNFTLTVNLTYADNTKPTITASGTTSDLDCNPSASDINAALGSASATDNCGTPTVTQTDGAVTGACTKSQTRTFRATDATGNTQTVTRTVSWIVDVTKPVFTGSYSAIDLDCNPTSAAIEAALGSASASDGCSTPSVSASDNTENINGCVHTQTRTFTATDHCGNTETVARTVSWIVDVTKPVFTGSYTSIDLDCNPTAAAIEAALGSASATDGCSTPSISASDNTENINGCVHTQTRTFTATDHCGNTETVTRTVSWIVDVTKPVFTGSYSAIDLDCNPTSAAIEAALGSASASDGCSTPSISASDNTEQISGCVHTQTRTFTATDHCGNTQTVTRTVSWIVDVTKPVFTGSYSAVDLDCNPTSVAIEAALGSASASDGCSTPSVSASDNTENISGCVHTQTRTFTATDHCGNTETVARTVSWIVDVTKPVFTGSYTSIDLDCNPTAAAIEAALGSASATDGCSTPSISASDNTEQISGCVHTQTRTFTATDHCGNTETVARTVSWIVDVTKPVFTGSYTSIDLDCNPTAAAIEAALGSASATDGCSTPSISASDNTENINGCVHTQTRTFTATDHCGNTETVTRTVSWIVDVTKPVFTGSYSAIDLDCNPTSAAIEAALGSASASDGCSTPSISASDNTEQISGCVHTQTRTFTATDHCGNTQTVTRTVSWIVDVTKPVFTGSYSAVDLDCNPTSAAIEAALGSASASDGCSTPSISASDNTENISGCVHTQTRTFTATDHCGNTETVSRTVSWIVDVTKPVFTGSYSAIDLDCNPTSAAIEAALGSASASDGCSTPSISASDNTENISGCVHTQTRTFTATDHCGNTETVTRTVSWIVDVTKPVFTGSYSSVDLDCNPTSAAIEAALGSASASDGCSTPSISASDNTENISGCVHTQTRTFTATDHCGNTETVTRTVSWIVDVTKPVFTGSYSAIDLDCNPTSAAIEAALGSASASDGCSTPSISASDNTENISGCVHTQTRTFTATDHCGNTETVTRTVSWIVDVTKPVFTGSYSAIDLDCNPTSAAIEAALGSASASDGCSTPSISASDNTENISGCVHTQTRTFTATDHCGNTETVTRTVSWIVDITKPVFTGSYSAVDLDCNPTAAAIEAALGSASASDGCSTPSISASDNTENISGCVHTQTRTFTAIDHCGNTETVTRTVSWIMDVTKPVFTGSYSAIDLDCNPTSAAIEAALGSASASDGCSTPSISASDNTENINGCVHTQTRTFNATDHCGNTETVTRTVSWIVDVTKPVFTGSYSAIDLDCNPTSAAIEAALGSASASDGCSTPSISASDNTENISGCVHTQTRTFTATDHCGNTETVTRTVSWIVDVTKPVFTGSYIAIDLDCNPTSAAIEAALGSASASDGCSTPSISASDNTENISGCVHTQTRTFTATDHCGNTETVTRTVSWIVDITKPVFTGSYSAVDLDCNPTAAAIEAALGSASASDGCSTPSISASDNAENISGCVHTQTRTFTATDHCGNTQTVTRTVSWIVDVTPPVISGVGVAATISCPATPSFSSPTTSDACGTASLSYTDATAPGTCANAYTKTRTWKATDHCGNTSTASQTITVVDNTAPSISCTTNKSVNPNNGTPACTYKHTGTAWNATASDLCSSATVIYNLSGATTSTTLATLNNAVFSSGVTTVTAIATDACGNSAQCSFTVTVTSTLTVNCSIPNNSLYYGYSGDQKATINVSPSGGTAPYTVSITMNRPLKCNEITNSGDELWAGALASNYVCPNSGGLANAPVSTGNVATSGGVYSVDATLMANAEITTTITDANGCTVTCSKNIYAEDARCFNGNSGVAKVTICHRTGSASNPCITICVDESAVAAHIAHGDFLGKCTPNCVAPVYTTSLGTVNTSAAAEVSVDEGFQVRAFPNPTENRFTVSIRSNSNEKVTVMVFDALGRQVKKIERADAMSPIQFGEDLKTGVYIIEVRQGENRKTIKLLKQ